MKKFTILTVDDSSMNQRVIKETFSEQFDVEFAFTGEECIKLIPIVKPDLILLDVTMPGIDGFETCKIIKSDDETKHIPVIFVSARVSDEDKLKGYKAGGFDYVTKPFDHNELIERTKNILATTTKESTNSYDISFSSDLDIITTFLITSFASETLEKISNNIFTATRSLKLSCSIQIDTGKELNDFSDGDVVSPLESQALEAARKSGDKYVYFGHSMIINSHNISLLIKNLPDKKIQNDHLLKETLFAIISGAEICTRHVLSLSNLSKYKDILIDDAGECLNETKENIFKIIDHSVDAFDKVINQVRNELEQTAVSTSEEDDIIQILTNYKENTLKKITEQ